MRVSEQLTLFMEDTHASRFHPRALEEVKRTLVTSGRILCDSLGSSGPLGLLERMLLGTYPSAWMPCCTIWRVQRTPHGRSVFRLELSERPTADTESSWLPTPTARDSSGATNTTAIQRNRYKRGDVEILASCPCRIPQLHDISAPRILRAADGLPNRTHRIKALGNAVVPQQAYPIFRAILKIEETKQ